MRGGGLGEVTQNRGEDMQVERNKHHLTPRYAWAVALGVFANQMLLVYSLKILEINMASIAADWGTTNASLGIMASFEGIGFGLFGALWGILSDKIGSRLTISAASFVSASAMVCFGLFVNDVPVGCVLMGLIGVAAAGSDTATLPKVASSWFHHSRRGIALTVFTVGGAVGGVVAGIIAGHLTADLGWRPSYVISGCICLGLAFVVLLLLRNSPEEEGTYAFGTPKDEVARMCEGLRPTSSGVRYDRRLIVAVLKNPTTYRYSVVMIFWYCWYMTYSSYLVASVQEAGFPVQVAALAVSAASLGCVTGSFVWSPLTDRFGRKGIFALVMAGAGLGSFGLLLFLNSGIANMAAMLAVVFCMGIFAASTPVMESSLAEHYRPDMRGIGPGIVSTFSSVGRFCGPLLAALVMTALGSTQSFSGGAAIVCSLAILIMVRKTGGAYGDPLAEKALREQDGSEAT